MRLGCLGCSEIVMFVIVLSSISLSFESPFSDPNSEDGPYGCPCSAAWEVVPAASRWMQVAFLQMVIDRVPCEPCCKMNRS